MSFEVKGKLIEPDELKSLMPLSNGSNIRKRLFDFEVADIIRGVSNKLLVIVGPCSAERIEPVLEYASKLAVLADEYKDKLLVIPRIYTAKPRSDGAGYKGILHSPSPMMCEDIREGIFKRRELHLKVIEETGLFAADEMLYPELHDHISDLISYISIGARSVENQQHRQAASGLDIPVGMKNPTGGDISSLFNSVNAAQLSQTYVNGGRELASSGNLLAHIVLRGYRASDGMLRSNYDLSSLSEICERYEEAKLSFPAVIVDTNHANSDKQYQKQPSIAYDVMKSREQNESVRRVVKGFMVESYLLPGSQPESGQAYGCSITDPCLGFDDTQRMLYRLAEMLN